jgi:hypothetical protein
LDDNFVRKCSKKKNPDSIRDLKTNLKRKREYEALKAKIDKEVSREAKKHTIPSVGKSIAEKSSDMEIIPKEKDKIEKIMEISGIYSYSTSHKKTWDKLSKSEDNKIDNIIEFFEVVKSTIHKFKNETAHQFLIDAILSSDGDPERMKYLFSKRIADNKVKLSAKESDQFHDIKSLCKLSEITNVELPKTTLPKIGLPGTNKLSTERPLSIVPKHPSHNIRSLSEKGL